MFICHLLSKLRDKQWRTNDKMFHISKLKKNLSHFQMDIFGHYKIWHNGKRNPLWEHYSRVHKSSDSFFPKILEKPSIGQKKMIPHRNGLVFWLIWSKKKNQNDRLRKFKMAASKNPRFPALPILNIFSWNFYGLVLGLIELIDAKGIEMSQLIWSWGCPTNSLKTQKTHFLSVFELMSDSLTTI